MTIVLYLFSLFLAQQASPPQFGSLSGQLRGVNGEVAAGIRIAASPVEAGVAIGQTPSELSNIGQTDGEGRYRLESVRPGRYLIMAFSLASPSYYPAGTTSDKGRIVTVIAGQAVTNLDFTIGSSSFPIISGTARFDDNTPVTNNSVFLDSLRLRFTRSGSKQNGSASLDGVHPQPGVLAFYGVDTPGTYTVTVEPLPLGYYVQSMTYGSTDLTRDPMVLTARLDNPMVDVVLSRTRPSHTPPGVKVSGRLLSQDPAFPNSSRVITLYKFEDNSSYAMALMDTLEDGSFEFDDVPPGRYAVAPNLPGTLRPNYPGTFDVGGTDVTSLEVKVGTPKSPVTLTPGSTTTIPGTVDIANGTIPEFEIQFVPSQEGAETRTVKISSREFSVLLPQGTYRARISGIPAGIASLVTAGPMDLAEPFLVTKGGIADRFTGVAMRPAGITIKLSKSGTN